MTPYVLIVLLAVIGFVVWGPWGLVVGAVIGHFASMLIGGVGRLACGGLLPRRIRTTTALSFLQKQADLVEICTRGLSPSEKRRFVERQVERIARKAVSKAPALSYSCGMSRPEIRAAAEQVAAGESESNLKSLLLALGSHIESVWY